MVERQIAARGVSDPAVLAAMLSVPREEFVAPGFEDLAYEDGALPIDCEQTISQPFVVALMAEALELGPDARVLDVGTGSGYAAAVLSRLARSVWTIERIGELAREAEHRLRRLGYANVEVRHGDGALGWPEHAPFDGISVAAAASEVPPALLWQLASGGTLVAPVGEADQQRLVRIRRDGGCFRQEDLGPVRFVPLVTPTELPLYA